MAEGSRFREVWRRWTRPFRRSPPKPEVNRAEQHDLIRSLEASEQWWISERPGIVINWVQNMGATEDEAEFQSDLGPAPANDNDLKREELEKAVPENAEKERKEKERQEKASKAAGEGSPTDSGMLPDQTSLPGVKAAPRRDTMTARGLYEKY